MSDYKLVASSPLDAVKLEFAGVIIKEVTNKSLVMLAMPYDRIKQIKVSLLNNCGLSIPSVGQSTQSTDGDICIWRLQKSQLFAYFTYTKDDAEAYIKAKLKVTSYYTDQSDSWAMISISGSKSRKALERICLIDLEASVFTVGSVARTVMEHIGAIIFHYDKDAFVILVMRSFAQSMLHALKTSVENIL